ncbi:MAG: bifunctional DNA-formamidopyrimidine glycosylase/DNA-(apurinic or apyrimidinic site) lyase [Hyphomicrobiaceae bacterium]|nr:bifunctional DNA-formamidopyrimidine glycosylase/DNA-(apurinic or apyrimidinic site) lyase [Hyphomicrobiaceae bacterium]
MPELPEVETVRRGLEPVLVGRRIVRVEQRRPDLRFAFPERFAARLKGRTVISLGRRAKYLLARLSDGEVLVMHLGMSGRFTVAALGSGGPRPLGELVYDTGSDPAHNHVVITLDDGTTITYHDPRRFGYMLLLPEAALDGHPLFAGLGVEPLGNALSPAYLAAKARGRRADLKAFLMDQRIVAGLGNIYVCEALYRARLSPFRAAASLATAAGKPTRRAERLVEAIRSVLRDAIAAGGSTLRDYRQVDGSRGSSQHAFFVYGREGEPCLTPGCRGIVQRSVQAGRSTFYCPRCQR